MTLRARHRLLPFLCAGAFLAFGLATRDDYGMTWDEAESWNAAASNLAMLLGSGEPWAATHVLPGYYFAIDTLRALFLALVGVFVSLAEPGARILAHHAFNLLLASASVGLLCALVLQISGRPRLAGFSAAALALMPPFVGHAPNNPKDIPALFAFLLVAWSVAGLARALSHASDRRAWSWVWLSAGALAFALTSRVLCASLIPILGSWLFWRRRQTLSQAPLLWIAVLAGGGLGAVVLWPWLWDAPVSKIAEVLGRISVHELVDFSIVYLGELHSWSQMPWHYRLVYFLVALPLVHWLLAGLSLAAARRWSTRADSRLDVVALAVSWLAVLAVVDQVTPYRYDGLRHFLPALPALAMLVGSGAEWLSDVLAQSGESLRGGFGRVARHAPIAICALVAATQVASTHPHQSAYMNAGANWLAGSHSEEWLELEFWGQAYQDGGRWINANTERDAIVYLPIGDNIAGYYARRQRGVWQQFEARFRQSAKPQYVMFITRMGFYDESIRRLEREYEPVYSLRVQNATLLKIYSNRSPRPAEADRG